MAKPQEKICKDILPLRFNSLCTIIEAVCIAVCQYRIVPERIVIVKAGYKYIYNALFYQFYRCLYAAV